MTNGSLETRITDLERQMQEIRDLLQQTAQRQQATQTQLDSLSQQFQGFLEGWSRINADLSDRIEATRAIADRNADAVANLLRNAEADRLENRINRDWVNVLIQRVEELLNQR